MGFFRLATRADVGASLGECLSRPARTTIAGFRISGSSPLLEGYDEPEILLSSTRSLCFKGANAGQRIAAMPPSGKA
jgi:hypothetical protein